MLKSTFLIHIVLLPEALLLQLLVLRKGSFVVEIAPSAQVRGVQAFQVHRVQASTAALEHELSCPFCISISERIKLHEFALVGGDLLRDGWARL